MKNKQVIAMLIMGLLISGCASSGPGQSSHGPRVFTPAQNSQAIIESEFKAPNPTDYRIGIDDLIEVNIWRHPDLSMEVIVRPDGKISYLLIGDVQAAGLTVSGLDELITKRFEEYAKKLQEGEAKEAIKPTEKIYRIGIGDGLDISVWKVPDLSMHVIVRPDGKISYPLIGDIQAYGKTLTELDDEMSEKLKKYVRDPQVSIMVTTFGQTERGRVTFVTEFISTFLEEKPEVSILVKRFGSRKVIVLGEVKNPGIYDIVGDAKLLNAIGYAGDFTDLAVRDNVFVIRGDLIAKPEVIKIDVWDIIKEGRVYNNIALQNQDIVYVPRSIIGSVKIFIETIYPNVQNLINTVTLRDAIKATWHK